MPTGLRALSVLGEAAGLPLVAAGDVHMHTAERRPLQDTLTAIRLGVPVFGAGAALYPNGERHLRAQADLARIYPAQLLEQSLAIAARCHFSLDELRYEYPEELAPAGETPISYLRRLTEDGLAQRCPDGVPGKVRALVEHELALIGELGYEPYFLTVHDIVRFARGRGILCQGRGSAANSAVCYALGITEVDPGAHGDAVRALHLAASATSRRTSTWTSSTSAARRSSSTSMRNTVASARRWPPPSSATGRAARCATSARPWASTWNRSTAWRKPWPGGTATGCCRSGWRKPASIPTMAGGPADTAGRVIWWAFRAICPSTWAAS